MMPIFVQTTIGQNMIQKIIRMNEKLGEQILHTQKRKQILQPWTYITEKATDIRLSHPVRIDYAENPEIVLQKTEYAAAEIHPCTYITETATNIALSPLVSTDYAENPEHNLQKQNMQQQKYNHIIETEIDTSTLLLLKDLEKEKTQ